MKRLYPPHTYLSTHACFRLKTSSAKFENGVSELVKKVLRAPSESLVGKRDGGDFLGRDLIDKIAESRAPKFGPTQILGAVFRKAIPKALHPFS